jgi:ankyrin repeat protein
LALLAKGADANAKAVDGSTALGIAKAKNNSDLVKVLTDAGAKG